MADPSNPGATPPGDWAPCLPGEFERLAGRLRARRRRYFLSSVAATLAGAAAAGGVWFAWWLNQETTYTFGGIACPDAVRLGPEYARGELAADVSEKIRVHVSQCPNCGPYFRSKGWPT